MKTTDATALREEIAQAHAALKEGAATSKRAIGAHRRALATQNKAMARLERACAQHGIELVQEITTQPRKEA